jgi:hypothetical protein
MQSEDPQSVGLQFAIGAIGRFDASQLSFRLRGHSDDVIEKWLPDQFMRLLHEANKARQSQNPNRQDPSR